MINQHLHLSSLPSPPLLPLLPLRALEQLNYLGALDDEGTMTDLGTHQDLEPFKHTHTAIAVQHVIMNRCSLCDT